MSSFAQKNNTPFADPANTDFADKNNAAFSKPRSDNWNSLSTLWNSLITEWNGIFGWAGWSSKNNTEWYD